jgi:hypothetical protein
MKETIQNKINSRNFTFMELLKLDDLAVELAKETYADLTTQERMEFAWEVKITATGEAFGELFRKATIESLRNAFAIGLKEFMENATVTSKAPSESEFVTAFETPLLEDVVSDMTPPELEQLSPAELQTTRDDFDLAKDRDKKTTHFETGADGIDLPKGVKRFE